MAQTKNNLSTMYQGVEIEFDEQRERWCFTMNGRDRSSGTLRGVKEMIDKPEPAEKKPFERFTALAVNGYGTALVECEVTSIAENGRFWVTFKDGKNKCREQKADYEVFEHSDFNKKIVQNIAELEKAQTTLEKRINNLQGRLKSVKVST